MPPPVEDKLTCDLFVGHDKLAEIEAGDVNLTVLCQAVTNEFSITLFTGRLSGPEVSVRLRGGTLVIERDGSRLVMAGPVRTVFRGEVPVGSGSRG